HGRRSRPPHPGDGRYLRRILWFHASDFHATKCHCLWLRLRFYCSHDPHRHQLRHHRRRADHLLPSNCCHLGGYWLETAKVSNMNEQLQEHAPKESLRSEERRVGKKG